MYDRLALTTKKLIPLCEPFFEGNEERYLRECIETGFVSYVGTLVERFEQ